MQSKVQMAKDNGMKPIILRRQSSLLQTRIISRTTEFEQMKGEVNQCEAQIRALTPQVETAAREAEAQKKEAIAKSNGATEPPPDVVNGEVTEKELEKELNQANVQVISTCYHFTLLDLYCTYVCIAFFPYFFH